MSSFADDTSIQNLCQLLRRIQPEWIVVDSNSGEQRISSQGFSNENMSVHIGDDLQAAGHRPEDVLERYPHMDLAAITAATARAASQAVCRDEVPGELCHGIVAGNKTRSVARRFAAEATGNWLVRRAR